MKATSHYSVLLCALFFSTVIHSSIQKTGKPVLVVLLMLKDEKDCVIPTLETYLSKNLLDGNQDTGDVAYVIFDNGSTDGTDTLAEDFFKKYHIEHYLIKKFPEWLGFGPTRNKALAAAREAYPESSLILFPDAEWYMRNFDELIDFCKQQAQKEAAGEKLPCFYRIWMKRTGSEFGQQRLFATHDDVEFEDRAAHECPSKYTNAEAPNTIYWELGCSKVGYEKSRKRWHRDRDGLLGDLMKNPKDPRTLFYLALTELWLEDYRHAYTYFKVKNCGFIVPRGRFFCSLLFSKMHRRFMRNRPRCFQMGRGT